MKVENELKTDYFLQNTVGYSQVAMFQLKLSEEGLINFPYVSKAIKYIFFKAEQFTFQQQTSIYLDAILKEDYQGFISSLQKAQQNSTDWLYEFRIQHNDEIRWIEVFANPEDEADGTITWHGYFKNITQHKVKDGTFFENESIFTKLIEKSTEGIVIVNAENRLIEMSNSGKKIFGIETVAEYGNNTVHPDDFANLSSAFKQVYTNPDYTPTVRFRCIKPNGEIIWIETNFNNKLADPSIKGIVMNVRDITEQKKTEQLLKNEQNLLRSIIDNLPLNVYVKDLESRKTLINKAELEYLGFKDEKEGLGKSDFETFGEEFAKTFVEEDQSVFRTGKAIINKETLIEDPSKRRVWYLLSKIPLVNENGVVEGLIGISVDITQQKLVQEQLSASELMFKNLAENVPGVVYQLCVDADGKSHFLFLSSKMEEIFGINFDHKERNISKYIYQEDKQTYLDSFSKVTTNKINWNYEGRLQSDNGEIKWFQGISSPTVIGDKTYFNGILLDITERKNSEEAKKHVRQLELSLEKEKEINLLKSRFISFASHEFRTPLATIVTSIDILGIYTSMLENADIKSKLQHHLDRVTSQAKRLTEMLSDVLLLEKSANDKITLQLEHLDIINLIKEINLQYYHERKDARTLELILPEVGKSVYSDASLLHHIINNLLDNAFKYSTNKPNPCLSLSFEEQSFSIKIKDYGIGIPKEDQENLFDIFFRATNVLNIDGTGLGLNITREFTHKLGGTITFNSEEGKGTEFTLVFPIQYHS